MAPTTSTVAIQANAESPSLLNEDQTLKASISLLKHITTANAAKSANSEKKNLLEDADNSKDAGTESTPIWLNITTKTHIIDAKRLKPSKIPLPHPFIYPPSTTICLITADPQRTFKDIVFATDSAIPFPAIQGGNVTITRVIGVSKIAAKYKQYEAQRQLRDEHDIFLADDRIITRLPQLLGKSFYQTSAKRPIPVTLTAEKPKENGKRIPSLKGKYASNPAPASSASKARDAKTMHAEIERTLNCALLALSPSTNTAVRIGYASWSASKIAENVESVTNQIVTKFVPKKWKGVRAIHIKGPNTTALPIWLAEELWADETMVLEDAPEEMKTIEGGQISGGKNRSKKRKAAAASAASKEVEPDAKKQKALPDGDDDKLDQEIALRKEKLKKQKEEAAKEIEEDVSALSVTISESKESKKSKKSKSGGKIKKSKSMDVLVGA